MTDFGSFTYYAQTAPGLERIAWREIEAHLPNTAFIGFRRIRDKNGIVVFEYRGDPKNLLQLRSTEDVFYLVAHEGNVPLDRRGLRVIKEAIKHSRYFDGGLRIHREVRGARARKRTTFRVIARKQGTHHRYRRVDAQRAVEQGISLRHLHASLRPTTAYAMVLLSNPQPDDVFLDPMCGAGTILIERALTGRYKSLLGGDLDQTAVATTLENIGPRYKPTQIRHWDATHLSLADNSVDKVVSNLPFGRQVGTHEDNAVLYPRFFHEMERVVRPGGRLSILSGEHQFLKDALAKSRSLRLREKYDILVLGMPATIYVINV